MFIRNARIVLFEAILVAVIGMSLALLANALSPRGLRLNRNYFPGGELSARRPPITNSAAAGSLKTDPLLEATRARIEQRGLQVISSNAVVEAFRDLRYEQGLFVFIDARDDQHYRAGHIPGAWQFDHYHAEKYFQTVLPICLSAQKVVVYCSGGACEDSEFTAVLLRGAGVPSANLFVYLGGITEWKLTGMPMETGARQSGELVNRKL